MPLTSDATVRVVFYRDRYLSLIHHPQVQDVIDDVAEKVHNYQLVTVPVDTGNLKAHLGIRKTSDAKRRVGVFGVDYAIYVENGHRARDGSWVPAQPYIKPSVDAARV